MWSSNIRSSNSSVSKLESIAALLGLGKPQFILEKHKKQKAQQPSALSQQTSIIKIDLLTNDIIEHKATVIPSTLHTPERGRAPPELQLAHAFQGKYPPPHSQTTGQRRGFGSKEEGPSVEKHISQFCSGDVLPSPGARRVDGRTATLMSSVCHIVCE